MGMTARPVPTRPIPERVVVVGCAGSGKTTLAREVAARLDARHIERDAIGDDEAPGFAALVAAAVEAAGRRWVFDGAPRAEAITGTPRARVRSLIVSEQADPDRRAPSARGPEARGSSFPPSPSPRALARVKTVARRQAACSHSGR
jgi:hypothetical protein